MQFSIIRIAVVVPRARGKKGVSLTLIEASERGQITKLEQSLGLNFTLAE